MPRGMIAAQHVRACMLRTPEPHTAVVATGVACIRTLDRLSTKSCPPLPLPHTWTSCVFAQFSGPKASLMPSHATRTGKCKILMICTVFWYGTRNPQIPHSPRSPTDLLNCTDVWFFTPKSD